MDLYLPRRNYDKEHCFLKQFGFIKNHLDYIQELWFPTLLIQGELTKKHVIHNFSLLKLETFSILLYKKQYELVQGESRETKNQKLFFFAIRLQSIYFTFLFIYQKLTSIQKFHSNLNFSSLKLETFSIMLYKKKYELDQGESRKTQNPKLFFFAIRLQSIFFTFLSIYSKMTFIQCHGFEPCQMEQYAFLCKNLEPFTVMLYKKEI